MRRADLSNRLSPSEITALAMLLEQHRPRSLDKLRRPPPNALAARIGSENLVGDVFAPARPKWAAFHAQTDLCALAWLLCGFTVDCRSDSCTRETRGKRDEQQEIPAAEFSTRISRWDRRRQCT